MNVKLSSQENDYLEQSRQKFTFVRLQLPKVTKSQLLIFDYHATWPQCIRAQVRARATTTSLIEPMRTVKSMT